MEWIQRFLLVFGSIFILTTITLGLIILFKLRTKNSVHATLFLKSGGQKKFLIDKQNTKPITINEETYIFEEEAVKKTAWRDFIYYKEGRSKPLLFEEQEPDMTPEELKIVMENDLVRKLFASKELAVIQLLLIICLVTGIITLGVLIFMSISGVNIKNNEENFAFLVNATKTAMNGGIQYAGQII